MELLEQQKSNDCLICCLAMFLTKYNRAPAEHYYRVITQLVDQEMFYRVDHAKDFHAGKVGLHSYFETNVLLSYGVNITQTAFFDFELDAILSVPSRKYGSDVAHAIVWDGTKQEVLDPANLNKYDNEALFEAIQNPDPDPNKQVTVMVDCYDYQKAYPLKKARMKCQENILKSDFNN